MDPELVVQSLNFHGQQLTKMWDSERGTASLQVSTLRDLDYQVFQKRSKDLGFQERAKRMRMHQFIVDKAPQLFKADKKSKDSAQIESYTYAGSRPNVVPMLPPLESFCHFDKAESRSNFFNSIRVGDVLIAQVQQKNYNGLIIRVIATDNGTPLRDVRELAIKGSIHPDHQISVSDRKDGQFNAGDLIRCEVIDLIADAEKLTCSMKGVHQPAGKTNLPFGLVTKEQLPKSYRAIMELDEKSYEECLQSNRTFLNPSAIEHLACSLGVNLGSAIPNSFLNGLSAPIPEKDYADELRKTQNGKWALKSVAEGIKYFKTGMETEAFQCLNKALHIDPLNVEGLVARGALYANKGSYDKAISDFELALKERPNHANATNYMSETLVAYAKQYEDEKNIDMAVQYYQKCLNINPNHKDARSSLQLLSKKSQRPNFNIDFLDVENGTKGNKMAEEGGEDGSERKSRRRQKRDKRGSSSNSGSSSSSRFSSSGSDSSRGRSRSKKARRKKSKHEPSLSPFSPMGGNPPPPGYAGFGATAAAVPPNVGYEKEVQNFIQRTALNDDYEKKVELFLQRVGQGGKDGKDGKESKDEKEKDKEKDKKKKKKKDRSKDKKKSSKREKSKKEKRKKKKKGSDDEDSEKQASPNLSGLDELGELEAKLSAVYNKLTAKESSKKKKKRKRHSSNSSNSSSSSDGSSSDSELERKKRKAKKALEDLAAAAGLLRGVGASEVKSMSKPEPVPVPPPSAYAPVAGTSAEAEDDYPGKWRPMSLKVKLGRSSDEPEVEESRMVYMKDEKKASTAHLAPIEPEEELPPGEDKVSFQIKSFGLFGPGNRQVAPKPVSPPKALNDEAKTDRENYHNRGGRYPQRGGYQHRGRGWNNNYNNNRGGYNNNRPYNNRPHHQHNNQGYDNRRRYDNNRGRNRGGYWEQRMQRSYSRSRSRSRSRSYSRSRSRSYSRSRSRSRQDNNRGRDSPQQNQDQNQQQQRGGNNERQSPAKEQRERQSSPRRQENKSDPTLVAASAAATVTPSASLTTSSDRRRMGGKWEDKGDDDEEDLVPPGCE
nr:EOG090X05S8 [Eurycercus lamellatus]